MRFKYRSMVIPFLAVTQMFRELAVVVYDASAHCEVGGFVVGL